MKTEIKTEVLRLVEGLPDDATWEDLQYAIYLRQAVDCGLEDSATGRGRTSDEVKAHFAARWCE
jgi:hypothetical protein